MSQLGDSQPIIQYWDSDEPPDYVLELTGSFAEQNPNRRHLLFSAESAEAFIAENFGTREQEAFGACGPAAMQADYLRYCAVYHHGGVWADAGFRCSNGLTDLLAESPGGVMFCSYAIEYALMNGLLAFTRPRHPFLKLAKDLATELISRRWEARVHTVTGPLVITTIYRLSQAGSVDAFLGKIAEMETRMNAPGLVDYGRTLCELIGGYEEAATACSDVRVLPAAARTRWVSGAGFPLPHREAAHWSRLGSDVYSEDRPGAPRPPT